MRSQMSNAQIMADRKAKRGTQEWTLAFLAAMNWQKYQEGTRQLLPSEIKEAEDLYGTMVVS